jgi:flagellar hook-associated protein 1 FlgK
LSGVQNSLNSTVSSDVTQVNQLLSDIAGLNHQIGAAALNGSTANDLNDSRQAKIEKLAGLLNVDVATSSNNEVNISVQGSSLVSGDQVADTLQTYADANGQLQLQTVSSSTAITPTGGSIQGAMEVRDGALKNLQDGVNSLASNLITEVNAVHSSGYSLTGASGAPFFTGASAADIAVNSDLSNNPALVQASGDASSTSDNQTALAMAQLGSKAVSGLNGQTFTGQYSGVVTALGQAASTVNSQAADQTVVQNMLTQQRNSTSGVSMDEEMTNMMTYQHAYEASAKIVSTVDSMLSTLIDMKQNP